MDVHTGSHRNTRMEYSLDSAEGKLAGRPPCPEERLDSGVDSLREDELVGDLRDLHVADVREFTQEYEPWRAVVTDDGDTLLHLAIIHEAQEHVLEMIKLSHNHPFLNVQNHQRQTALHLAVITDQPQLVERLIRAGADPRLPDNSGNTALHIACKKGALSSFGVITQNCHGHLAALVSCPNYSGHNCLHLASINGYVSLVESLVKLGADINAQEQCSGRTALHLAVDFQNLPLVRCLVDLGADVNSLNYGGFAPYHLTYGRPNEEIRQQLYHKTARELRPLPASESDESEMEDLDLSDDELYDDIKFGQ